MPCWSNRRRALCAASVTSICATASSSHLVAFYNIAAGLRGPAPRAGSTAASPIGSPGRMLRRRDRGSMATIVQIRHYASTIRGVRRSSSKLAGTRTVLVVPMLKDGKPIGVICRSTARRCAPFADKQIELVHELRRPGRHRYRERTVVRRGAGSHARAARVAGAADRHGRGAAASSPVRPASSSRCSTPCWRTRCGLCAGQLWQHCGSTKATDFASWRYIARRRRSANFAWNTSGALFHGSPDGPHQVHAVRTVSRSMSPIFVRQSLLPAINSRALVPTVAGIRTVLAVPMLKENELIGVIDHLPPGGPTLHRQAGRAGHELRRSGRDRHREYAPAQRAARIPAAADRHRRRAQGHQPLDLRSQVGAANACRISGPALRRQQ